MQNLTDKDRNEIVNSVEKSLQSKAPERSKTMTLGLSFINVVGEDILKAAIDMANLDKRPKAEMSAIVGKVAGHTGDAKLEGAPQTPPEAVPNLLVPLEAAVNEEKIAPAVDKLRKKLDKKTPKPKTAAKS